MTVKIVKNIKEKNEFKKIKDQIYSSREFRKELANNDMFWFYTIYFTHYITYPTAKFQKEMISLVSDEKHKTVAITSFRNSAKSTICSLILPIWAIVGKWKLKYVVIVCKTQTRSKETLANIRAELEKMGILVEDYQPKEGNINKWSEDIIVIPKYNAKISAISVSEGVRSTRYLQYRPKLIVFDDLEDVQSCQNYENRDKLWEFVNGEIVPIGDIDTKYIYIGNKIHNDSLMMRIKNSIESGKKGIYREYPLVDKNGKIAWPGKFKNMDAIENLKASYASDIDFNREQMLIILPDGDAVIKPEDIHYYDELPTERPEYILLSIDPAYSLEKTSDNTAIIKIAIYRTEGRLKFYIIPPIVNQKLETDGLINKVKEIIAAIEKEIIVKIFVEKVAGQKTLIDMFQYVNIPAEGIEIGGKDKKIRLSSIAPWIKNGQILFPKIGAEDLINQLLYFGTEKNDDTVDALTLAINKIIKDENQPNSGPIIVKVTGMYKGIDLKERTRSSSFYNGFINKQDWADKQDAEYRERHRHGKIRRILG